MRKWITIGSDGVHDFLYERVKSPTQGGCRVDSLDSANLVWSSFQDTGNGILLYSRNSRSDDKYSKVVLSYSDLDFLCTVAGIFKDRYGHTTPYELKECGNNESN